GETEYYGSQASVARAQSPDRQRLLSCVRFSPGRSVAGSSRCEMATAPFFSSLDRTSQDPTNLNVSLSTAAIPFVSVQSAVSRAESPGQRRNALLPPLPA